MRYDFIETFTDIDDDLIVCALPEAQNAAKLKPKKRPLWKPLTAAAACLAAVGIAFGVMTAVKSRQDDLSALDDMSWVADGYPADAKYKYEGDFSELDVVTLDNKYEFIDFFDFFDYTIYYDSKNLVQFSDLIVVGTFVDDARQDYPLTTDPDFIDTWERSHKNYNKLRIDRVFKGDVEVGEELLVYDNYYVNNNKLYVLSKKSNTPMIKGEQWIFFLGKSDTSADRHGAYVKQRFPVPGNENTFVLTNNTYGVFDEAGFSEADYEDVKKLYYNKLDVNKLTKWEYDGKVYNVMNYSGKIADGVNFYVGTTKDTYTGGDHVEALAVIENNSDKDVTLYMGSSGGTDFLSGSSLVGVSDACEGKVINDTAEGRSFDTAISNPVIRAGETVYQKLSFSTWILDKPISEGDFIDFVPAGLYSGRVAVTVADENDRLKPAKDVGLSFSVNIEGPDMVSFYDRPKFHEIGSDFYHDGKTYKLISSKDIVIRPTSNNRNELVRYGFAARREIINGKDTLEIVAFVQNLTSDPVGLLSSGESTDEPLVIEFVTDPDRKNEFYIGYKVFDTPAVAVRPGNAYYQKASFQITQDLYRLSLGYCTFDCEEYEKSGTINDRRDYQSLFIDFMNQNSDYDDVLTLFGITDPAAEE